jgi:hypothetical protein
MTETGKGVGFKNAWNFKNTYNFKITLGEDK